jgi:hypothetical protein
VDDEVAADAALGLVHPVVGGAQLGAHRVRVDVAEQRGHREVHRVGVVAEHLLDGLLDALESVTSVATEAEHHGCTSCGSGGLGDEEDAEGGHDDEEAEHVGEHDAAAGDRLGRERLGGADRQLAHGSDRVERASAVRLNRVWTSAIVSPSGRRTASEAISAVIVVPTLAPRVIG